MIEQPQIHRLRICSSLLITVKPEVKRTPQNSIIQKLSPLAVLDFRFISKFLHA